MGNYSRERAYEAEGRWLDWVESKRMALDYGRWSKWPRRAAVVAFPVTVPLWFAWFLLWVIVFVVGSALVTAIAFWHDE